MENPQWLITLCDYSGQSLAIRLRPPSAISDARKQYGHLFVVTHDFACVRGDGLPEPDYNDTLHEFDCELIGHFELDGRVVLVEKEAGESMY
jgi:hypothetical protein